MQETFVQLRALMLESAKGMIVAKDGPGGLVMHAPIPHPWDASKPMWFGAVQPMKNYVSYHLMPVYSNPVMQAKISPDLKKRMQGKSCFNFKTVDKVLFKELGTLTKKGYQRFKKEGLV